MTCGRYVVFSVYSIQHYVIRFVSDNNVYIIFSAHNAFLENLHQVRLAPKYLLVAGLQFSLGTLQHYVIKFVSDLWQVCGILCVLYTALCYKVCQ